MIWYFKSSKTGEINIWCYGKWWWDRVKRTSRVLGSLYVLYFKKKLAWRKVAAFSWIWTLYFWTAHQRYSWVGLRQASLQPELLDQYWIPYLPACVCAQLLHSCLTLCNPVDCSPQAPLSGAFSKQEYWNGLPYSPLWIFPTQGSNSCLLLCTWVIYCWATWETPSANLVLSK